MTISKDEYQELKAFLSFYSSKYLSIDIVPLDMRPAAALERLEKKNARMASQGLHQAINDIIERSRHIGPQEVEKIDSELRVRNLVTLSELRRRFSKDYARIVKREKINTESEYYIVRGMLDDEQARLTPEERDLLDKMICEFEAGT